MAVGENTRYAQTTQKTLVTEENNSGLTCKNKYWVNRINMLLRGPCPVVLGFYVYTTLSINVQLLLLQ